MDITFQKHPRTLVVNSNICPANTFKQLYPCFAIGIFSSTFFVYKTSDVQHRRDRWPPDNFHDVHPTGSCLSIIGIVWSCRTFEARSTTGNSFVSPLLLLKNKNIIPNPTAGLADSALTARTGRRRRLSCTHRCRPMISLDPHTLSCIVTDKKNALIEQI